MRPTSASPWIDPGQRQRDDGDQRDRREARRHLGEQLAARAVAQRCDPRRDGEQQACDPAGPQARGRDVQRARRDEQHRRVLTAGVAGEPGNERQRRGRSGPRPRATPRRGRRAAGAQRQPGEHDERRGGDRPRERPARLRELARSEDHDHRGKARQRRDEHQARDARRERRVAVSQLRAARIAAAGGLALRPAPAARTAARSRRSRRPARSRRARPRQRRPARAFPRGLRNPSRGR